MDSEAWQMLARFEAEGLVRHGVRELAGGSMLIDSLTVKPRGDSDES